MPVKQQLLDQTFPLEEGKKSRFGIDIENHGTMQLPAV